MEERPRERSIQRGDGLGGNRRGLFAFTATPKRILPMPGPMRPTTQTTQAQRHRPPRSPGGITNNRSAIVILRS